MNKKINQLLENLNLKFKNINLIKQALTHKSYDAYFNYEKLEFLGDRVLGLIISKKLLDLYPNEKEGILDKKLASLVNRNKCLLVGKNLFLNKFIFIGNKKQIQTVENKIISDCTEALIGAIYIDKGFDFTQSFVLNLWKDFLKLSDYTEIDAKTKLQEYSLKKYKSLPIYKLIAITGPKHKPNFKIAVRLKNSKFVEGTGSSKKQAELFAAENLFKKIKL